MSRFKARQNTVKKDIEPPAAKRRVNAGLLGNRIETDNYRGNDIWLTTLSDLLMLLVIFFVILFGMEFQKRSPGNAAHAGSKETVLNKTAQTEKKESAITHAMAAPAVSASIEKELAFVLGRETGEQEVTINRAANIVTVTFPERIIFDPGHARLKPDAGPTLDKVAAFIKERAYLAVEVQGHTDNRPINNPRYPSNWELSADRATQVARALIAMGVNPVQLSVKGFGEHRALLPNDSEENRLKNRRVEIQFSIAPGEPRAGIS